MLNLNLDAIFKNSFSIKKLKNPNAIISFKDWCKNGLGYELFEEQLDIVKEFENIKEKNKEKDNLVIEFLAQRYIGKTDIITIAYNSYLAYLNVKDYRALVGYATMNKGQAIKNGLYNCFANNNIKITKCNDTEIRLDGCITKDPTISFLPRSTISLQGKHFTHCFLDDILVNEDRFSEATMYEALQFYNNILACIKDFRITNKVQTQIYLIGQLVSDNKELDLYYNLLYNPNIIKILRLLGSMLNFMKGKVDEDIEIRKQKTIDSLKADGYDDYHIATNYLLKIPKNLATYKVCSDFNKIDNVDDTIEYDPKKILFLSFDFNINPMCCACFHKIGDYFIQFSELVLKNTNIDVFTKQLCMKFERQDNLIIITGDASGQMHRVENDKNLSCYQQIKNVMCKFFGENKIAIQVQNKNPLIINRIRTFNINCLQKLYKINKINCPFSYYSLLNLYYKIGTNDIDDGVNKKKTNDFELAKPHIFDAISYLLFNFSNIKNEV